MDNKNLKGIALILFGMLLCIGGTEVNNDILVNFVGFPFALIGIIIGCIGVAIIFIKKSNN